MRSKRGRRNGLLWIMFRVMDPEGNLPLQALVSPPFLSLPFCVLRRGLVIATLTTQRNAVKMLNDRMNLIISYLEKISLEGEGGGVVKDPEVLRMIGALIVSLPASDSEAFREEFMTVSSLSFLLLLLIPLLLICEWRTHEGM